MASTRTNSETTVAAGLTPEQAVVAEKLNLHPRQRLLLEEVLVDYPELSVRDAHQILKSGGM